MTERSYQDAVQVLKDRLSSTWEGAEIDGRDEMERILKEELGYDHDQADDAIDAMIESGVLRYHPAAEPEAVPVPPVPFATGGTTTSSPLPAPIPLMRAGYWQIGDGVVESTGRKGQVTPR
jgi:hypothetical protein